MATPKKAYVWYDPDANFLEVIFESKEGFFEKSEHEQVRVKVDKKGNVLGFRIQRVSHLKGSPFEVELKPRVPESTT